MREGFNRLKQCRHGLMLYNANDVYIGRSFDLYGEFSELEAELFGQLVSPGDIAIDVGANVGAHTVGLARLVGPGGAVLAFEPQRVVYQTLCANVALNSITHVHCWNVALGDAPGTVKMPPVDYARPNNFGGLSATAAASAPGDAVSVLRLDDLPVPRCSLIKVDVEGMELQVLRGGRAMVRRLRPVLYVENDREHASADLVRWLDAAGYNLFWHCPPLFNPANYAGNRENVFGDIISKNMLCVPKEKSQSITGLRPVAIAA
jgi:FkbM family methyltransferase